MKTRRLIVTLVALQCLPVPTFAAEPCADFQLIDVTERVGISFTHNRGATGLKHLPETMGAGLAWLDFDDDGWQDIYLVQSGPFPPVTSAPTGGRLFRNLGGRAFEEVDLGQVATSQAYDQGALASDLDGNGTVDLLVTGFGGDRLLLNQGDGSFADASDRLTGTTPGWSSSAAAADADGDGDLDLYISRYVDYDPLQAIFCGDPESGVRRYCDPSIFAGARDRYFENSGAGQFRETSQVAGLIADGRGLGVLFADLDDDLRPEIYVANDLTPNSLFHNLGGGRFEDVSLLSGAAVNREGRPEAGMGLALGDHNGDLIPDLAVTNFDVETNTYYEAQGELFFADRSAASGFGTPSFNFLAFGIVTADLDGDADLDIYVANGHIFEQPNRDNTTHLQPDQILLGDGQGGFEELDCQWLSRRLSVARGLALADFDNDGDPDLASQWNGGAASLLRNELPAARWIGLVLRGAPNNTEAIGARVVLQAAGAKQARWVIAGDSYQSSSDRRVRFGLAGETSDLSLELRWPDGRSVRVQRPPTAGYLVFPQR